MKPYEECPSFDKCSCNKCPLDPDIDSRIKLPDDEKCKAHKPTRMKIAAKFPELLPYQGLTKKAWTAKKSWHDKTPAEKQVISERLGKIRKNALGLNPEQGH